MDDTLVDAGELELFEKYSGDLAGYLSQFRNPVRPRKFRVKK
jgi:hypothetical protein